MATYIFVCQKTKESFQRDYSYSDFDKIRNDALNVECEYCHNCKPNMIISTKVHFIIKKTIEIKYSNTTSCSSPSRKTSNYHSTPFFPFFARNGVYDVH